MIFSIRGSVDSFIVTAQPDNWDNDKDGDFPYVAQFHVTTRYPVDEQRVRAQQYRDYMNSQQIEPDPIK